MTSLFAGWQGFNLNPAKPDHFASSASVEEAQIVNQAANENEGSPALVADIPGKYVNSGVPTAFSPKARWAPGQIKALPSPENGENCSPVLVAVLDTGIDKNHRELAGKVAAEINLSGSVTAGDIYGHGTSIAGIITGGGEPGSAIAGVAPESRLLNVKVADDQGKCQIDVVARGIIWAVDNGARVINISLELKETTPELQDAVDYAWNRGSLIIAAAGNDGDSFKIYPAGYDDCVSVTAVRDDGTLVPLANYGDWVDVAAPGLEIYTTTPGSGYGYKSGTSFATAYISGLAAKLFPVMTDTNGNGRINDEVRRAIEAGYPIIPLN
jgi:thermitase